MEGRSSTHPAGAITTLPDGRLRQAGDFNLVDLNSSPVGEATDEQSGDLSAEARKFIEAQHTQPATDVQTDRPDIGTE